MAEHLKRLTGTSSMLVYGRVAEVHVPALDDVGAEHFEEMVMLAARYGACEEYPDKVIGIARVVGWHYWRWGGTEEEPFKMECEREQAEMAAVTAEVNVGHMQLSFDA